MRATLISDIIEGIEPAPQCDAAVPSVCPRCWVRAVLPLDARMLAQQPDETTHVCHPTLDGCNQGYGS